MFRYLIALVLAAFITLGLFFLMQTLIKSGDTTLDDPAAGKVLDFVRVQQEEQVQQKERKPKKPPKPQEPPQMDQPQLDSPTPDGGDGGLDFAANLSNDVALDGGLALDSGDGEYVPITKVQAVYPRRALQRGIQGYVIVEFTVNKIGAVINPVVVEAQPEGIFEQAALDAVVKFKYKPRVINGEPTEVAGVQNRISFAID